VQRLLASVGLCLLGLGCGGRSESAPLELARQLAQAEPRLQRALGRSRLEARGAAASSPAAATDPFVRLPAKADGTLDFRAGERTAPLARLRTLGASSAALELVDGVAIYRDAVGGADAIWLLRGNAVEQLLLAQEPPPELTFAWQLCRVAGLGSIRRRPELGIVFADAHGTDRLRVPPPFALDARGQRRELELQYHAESETCGRLDFTLDTRGLTPPLLVDPALEAVIWTDRTDPDHKPLGRYGHGLAYDPVRKKTVLYGGTVNEPPPFLSDTWEWDGAAWHDVSGSEGPGGRLFHDLAYSSLHGGAVLIGGVTAFEFSSARNDVWRWDDDGWTQLEPAGDELPLVAGHAIAFDSARKVMVLYGGFGLDEIDHVWELGDAGWTDRGDLAVSPGSVDMFSMAYDAAHQKTLLFGGSTPAGWSDDPFNPRSDATYLWNGKGWTGIDPERPSPRSGMASAYDEKRGRIVLFGGTPAPDGGQFSDETWEYGDGRFELREPLRRPPARESARLAYDAERDRMVLFGGFGLTDGDDTWTYAHFGNTCHDEADCDGEACVDGVCCQDKLCGTCEACSEETGTCQPLKSMDDPEGGCAGERTCDEKGACLPRDGQSCQRDRDCASQHCADGVCCDRACDGACEACDLPDRAGTCSFVEGEAAHGACPGRGPCATSCDGRHPDCSPVPEGRDCGTTCADALLTVKTCDADGVCRSTSATECAEHLLCQDAQSCLERCESRADCQAGFECRSGVCTELGPYCVDEATVEGPGGREDCGAYVCASGKCKTSCARASDCAGGRVCDEEGQCLTPQAAASPVPTDDGCGCRTAGGTKTGGWLWVLGALLARRRRQT
jgi:MYXO-CTERM domain-containing protein